MAEPNRGIVELVVQGPAGQALRRQLIEGQTVRLGRAPANGWAVEWDRSISREHADLLWQNGRLSVTCLPTAANPIRLRGEPLRVVEVGGSEAFEIGQSTFFVDVKFMPLANIATQTMQAATQPLIRMPQPTAEDEPKEEFHTQDADEVVEEHSYNASELKNVSFGDTERQMEVLSDLPRLISGSTSDVDLALMLCGLLLDAIPPAVAVAVTLFEDADVHKMQQEDNPDAEIPKPKMMRVQTRDEFEGRFMPSRRLLRKALRLGESVMHIVGDVESSQFTMATALGWAFCAPITAESCVGWCLYVSGSGGRDENNFITEESLKGDLRFTQLVAQLIGSIRTVRSLQDQKTQLSAFFSPKVVANLTKKGGAGDILAPSERDITVLFCDVRGFSRKSEQLKDDLHKLLDCVKAALGAMTGGILAFDGSIADFQGDAALGFWGWPTPLPDGPMAACRAAFSILQAFDLPPGEQGLLEGFTCGVGIAHGRAIAGQIGTSQQAKIGVFGPIVNQGSRIEGLTRQFGVGICIDEQTANFVRRLMPPQEGRCRRLARLRPKGMDTTLLISELLPPEVEGCLVTDTAMLNYEAALEMVIAGRWTEAIERLNAVPDEDGAKQFLLKHMAKFDNKAPDGWDGAFSLDSK
ncbi:MAG: adenylate/guanylate cyclase domain-containing protein [Planctomycetaceae bacterium]|nr:adenylate/guanylate cyclase domain-containing protein [Planctomycetaceae bacterium]